VTAGISQLKILYGYSWFSSEAYGDVQEQAQAYFRRLSAAGYEVEGFCLTLAPPGPALTFPELDKKWRRRDRALLEMYERFLAALEGKHAFINGPGINLHPEFVETLPVFSAFQCFDDPENSHNLSRPVAASYDLCLVGNAAELQSYSHWGAKHVEWSPMGLQPTIYDQAITYESILNGARDIDLFMMVDRLSPSRQARLDRLAAAIPDGHFYGRGWPRGFLPNDRELEYLRRSKVGPNIHNSTGPINYRTFYLPANGVMQICDNKSHLGTVFELGKEVVGFDDIGECIDLCRYYIDHDEERRVIAAHGWKRAVSDYSEVSVFGRIIAKIEHYMTGDERKRVAAVPDSRIIYRAVDTLRSLSSKIQGKVKSALLPGPTAGNLLCQNVGGDLLEWPERVTVALELLASGFSRSEMEMHASVGDYGCGKQTLRKVMPATWKYTPYDYCSRSSDTVIRDFNNGERPEERHDIVFCLGVLEYLDCPLQLLDCAIANGRFVVFSYNGFTTEQRRRLQGWRNNLAFADIESQVVESGGRILAKKELPNNERVYILKGKL